jgi:hypothetical protein
VKEYYHVFKIRIMFSGLNECMEDVMNRFMRGLNSEIRTLLIGKSYSHIGQLFCLVLNAEKEILSFVNTCKNDVTHNVQNLSTLHANQEQQIVEPAIDSTCYNMNYLLFLVIKRTCVLILLYSYAIISE